MHVLEESLYASAKIFGTHSIRDAVVMPHSPQILKRSKFESQNCTRTRMYEFYVDARHHNCPFVTCNAKKLLWSFCTGWGICSDILVRLTLDHDVPPSCPTSQPDLPISHQPKQRVEQPKLKSTKPSYPIRCPSLYSNCLNQ